MGAGSSKPPPPPRIAKKLAGTTVQLKHLPPLIHTGTKEGILAASLAKALFLSSVGAHDTATTAIAETHGKLSGLIAEAHRDGSFRDYLVLLVEKSMLGLITCTGVVPQSLLELARVVNPFLDRSREDAGGLSDLTALHSLTRGRDAVPRDATSASSAFRASDLELVTGDEKDLLVLLYYTHDLGGCADEAIDYISTMAGRGLTDHTLERRREPFSEIEIYTLWAISYITSLLASKPIALSPKASAQLHAESEVQVPRLLTACDTLLKDHRLDQICFLLRLLRGVPAGSGTAGVPPRRVRALARRMGRKRNSDGRDVQAWHVAYAEGLVSGLRRARAEARGRWGWWRGRVRVRVVVGTGGEEGAELQRVKKD